MGVGQSEKYSVMKLYIIISLIFPRIFNTKVKMLELLTLAHGKKSQDESLKDKIRSMLLVVEGDDNHMTVYY